MAFYKRMLAMAAALLMTVGVVGLGAVPAEKVRADAQNNIYQTEGEWEYEILEDGTANLMCYGGSDIVIEVPKSIAGRKVTGIGGSSYREFCGNQVKKAEKVIIPDTVTSIGVAAFWGCSSLKEIVIPDSVTYIGGVAFEGTKWLEEQRAKSPLVAVNGILVDAKTAKGDVKIPDGVVKISPLAFSENKDVTSVEMPDTVAEIGFQAFARCTSLKSVKLSEGLTATSNALFIFCDALESVNIPWRMTYIARDTFYCCSSLERIDIPFGVTEIAEEAFCGTAIRDITLPEGVEKIGDKAFDCDMLESVKIPRSVKEIGENLFGGDAENKVIYGYAGTAAEAYAAENDIAFMVLDTNPSEEIFSTITVNPAAGDTAAEFEMGKMDIMYPFSLLLDKEEFEDAIYGNIRFDITLSVTKTDESVSEADRELILNAVDSASKEGKANYKVMNYFDIQFGATVGDREVKVIESPKAITISVPIDNAANGVYKVARIHGGEAELLDAELSGDGTRLIFETDKFSTYAIVYSDVASGGGAPTKLIALFVLAGLAMLAAGGAIAAKRFNFKHN
ncbi:MAG: leucine-rich repeat domain-containing protein [Butyrivibrio sp.]|nr:leucine-rich repeat domain-containing protein [Butyrivibrio sp.]